jgi:hypothetical protein
MFMLVVIMLVIYDDGDDDAYFSDLPNLHSYWTKVPVVADT